MSGKVKPRNAKRHSVMVVETGPTMIGVVKVVREITSGCAGFVFARQQPPWGLKESVEFARSLPAVLLSGLTRPQADKIANRLRREGALAEVVTEVNR
jgi:ribosomal protein L7/L12